MKLLLSEAPICLKAFAVLALATPSLATDVEVVASGTVTSVSGPGLTDPALGQLVLGQQVDLVFRSSPTGSAIPNGFAYSVSPVGSGVETATSVTGAINAPTLNMIQVIDEPASGMDSIVASMELPGQATALLQLSNGTGSYLPSALITSYVGTAFVPFGGASLVGEISDGNSVVEFSFNIVVFSDFDGPIGTNYCLANPNSTGLAALMSAEGSSTVADNDLTLVASNLPSNAFGFFITSQTQGLVFNPGGSDGNLCLSGSIGRYVGPGQIQQVDSSGTMMLPIDLMQVPQPNGPVAAMPGDVWNFQAWFRDSSGAGATSNLTDGIELVFI